MLVDLSDVLTTEGKVWETEVFIGLESFSAKAGTFPITEKSPFRLRVSNLEAGKVRMIGDARLVLKTECDRCLTDVLTEVKISVDRIAVSPDVESEEEEDRQFMEDYQLDVDALVQSEMIVNWPFKILCKEDCKGICPKCGQNLNMGMCGCDTFVPDPRMAVLKDIFESNKEVE